MSWDANDFASLITYPFPLSVQQEEWALAQPFYGTGEYMTNWKYFNRDEFKCHHCDRNKIDEEFIDLLDDARENAGIPFVINSGYRCPIHNMAVGGSPTSSHLKGCAVDILATDDEQRMKIVASLVGYGFSRIGIAKNFIHVDDDKNKNPVRMWVY